MVYSYYPGCTLKNKAAELDKYARAAAFALGVELKELPAWQCCGAVYPMNKDEIAGRLSSVRALDSAKRQGNALLTLCSACHHVLKRVNHDMAANPELRAKANNYLTLQSPYGGETEVVHYLEMLRGAVGFSTLKQKVKKPLAGKRIGAYYGCLLLRPSAVMRFDNPENPSIMEDFLEALGAQPVVYPLRNECCGGYISLESPQLAAQRCREVLFSAKEQGAQMLVTACPLCMYNLEKNGHMELPVVYFTQLLAEALDVGGTEAAHG